LQRRASTIGLPDVRLSRPTAGRSILWDDTFTRYHEPEIGIAAVAVLEAAIEVTLPAQRQMLWASGLQPGQSKPSGEARAHNLALLNQGDAVPIIFLEPSCFTRCSPEDYRELKLPDTERVAQRCILFEEFIGNFLKQSPNALKFNRVAQRIVIHAIATPNHWRTRLHAPARGAFAGAHGRVARHGCCGMAGAFGMLKSKYELSLQSPSHLSRKLSPNPSATVVVASGTSLPPSNPASRTQSHTTHGSSSLPTR